MIYIYIYIYIVSSLCLAVGVILLVFLHCVHGVALEEKEGGGVLGGWGPVESPPSGRCPVISGSGEPGGLVGVQVAKHHLVSTVLQKSVKVRGVVPKAGGAEGMYTLTKVNVVPLRLVSTARTSAASSSGRMPLSGAL